MLRISQAGIDIIKKNEGCRLVSYWDALGHVWTIGWGHTGPDVHALQRITQATADALLGQDLEAFENGVLTDLSPDAPTTQGQFDAMVSLAYNIGMEGFASSSVLRLHKEKEWLSAANAFLLWDKSHGQVVPGLLKRRYEERALYLSDSPKTFNGSEDDTLGC